MSGTMTTTTQRKIQFDGDVCSPYDLLFKVLVVGDSGVGKSSLVKRFADDEFVSSYITTIGVDYEVRTFKDAASGKRIKLQLWDTAGQERFRAITKAYYQGAHGILLVYDRTDPESIRNLEEVWLPEVARYARSNVQVLVVGNKADLRGGDAVTETVCCERLGDRGVQCVRTSAKTGSQVDDAFLQLVETMMGQRLSDLEEEKRKRVELDSGRPIGVASSERCCIIA